MAETIPRECPLCGGGVAVNGTRTADRWCGARDATDPLAVTAPVTYRLSSVSADAETTFEAAIALTAEASVGGEVLGTFRISQPYVRTETGPWRAHGGPRVTCVGGQALPSRLRGAALLLDPLAAPAAREALARAYLAACRKVVAGIERSGDIGTERHRAACAQRDAALAALDA